MVFPSRELQRGQVLSTFAVYHSFPSTTFDCFHPSIDAVALAEIVSVRAIASARESLRVANTHLILSDIFETHSPESMDSTIVSLRSVFVVTSTDFDQRAIESRMSFTSGSHTLNAVSTPTCVMEAFPSSSYISM